MGYTVAVGDVAPCGGGSAADAAGDPARGVTLRGSDVAPFGNVAAVGDVADAAAVGRWQRGSRWQHGSRWQRVTCKKRVWHHRQYICT